MPEACAGATAVIVVAEITVNLVASTVPNLTLVAAERPVPVMTTFVPPAVEPLVGARPVTVGTGTYV